MRLLISALLICWAAIASPAQAQDVQSDFNLEQLSAEEAWRLLYVTPKKSPSPEGMILQWEDQRGGLKLYLTNRGAEPVVVDWGGSQFVDASGSTWSIRSKKEPEASTAHVGTGELLEARLLLVSGPKALFTPADLGREVQLNLLLWREGQRIDYSESFRVGMDIQQAVMSMWREQRHAITEAQSRSVGSTTFGVITALAGTGFMVYTGLNSANLDSERFATRMGLAGVGIAFGGTITLTSSTRRKRLSFALEQHDARRPGEGP